MKKLSLVFLCLFAALSVFAQDKELERFAPEIKEVISPDFEWGQFDNSLSKCRFKKDFLELECRKNKEIACTCTELDFDPKSTNFILTYQMETDAFDDKHKVGIVFDYKNIKNFQALCFGKKQFSLLSYENGDQAVVKEGLYKLDTKNKLMVTIKKKGKRLDIYLGTQYLPLTSLKNTEFSNPQVGFFVENATKLKITGFGYRIITQGDSEEEE